MEQHPVPQDIKSFQFRLVGDMTLRQFAFLAGGAIIAYVTYVLPLPSYLKYPLVIFFAGGGAATAFVPINERPLDRWVTAFFRAVFGPTRRVWIKSPNFLELFTRSYAIATPTALPTTTEEDRQRLEEYLATLPPGPEEAVDKSERELLEKIDFTLGQTPTTTQKPAESKAVATSRPSYAPQVTPLPKPLQVKDQDGQEKILPQLTGVRVRRLGSSKAPRGEFTLPPSIPTPSPPSSPVQPSQKPLSPAKPPPSPEPTELFADEKEVTVRVKEEVKKHDLLQSYQEQVKRLETEKEILQEKVKEGRQQAEKLRIQKAKQQTQAKPATKLSEPPKTKAPQKEPQKPTQPPSQELDQPSPPPTRPVKKLVLPTITDTPNVINGVVADQQGELLEGAILVIKDSEGTPVRALKTNKLGQFTISTPLRNGTYSIEGEKENYVFEPIYQEVTGTILPPLEIRAKKIPLNH
jgi:hypothetical protein